jgi:hypothetical protein
VCSRDRRRERLVVVVGGVDTPVDVVVMDMEKK